MMKKHKDYYRLSEIKDEFGITSFDYLYLCEKYKNPIYFYVHHQLFLVGEELYWNGELNGVAYYKGLIRLERDDRIRLIRNGVANIRQCYLDDREGILSFEPITKVATLSTFETNWTFGEANQNALMESSIRSYPLPSRSRGHVLKCSSLENVIRTSHKCRNDFEADEYCLQLVLKDMVVTEDDISWAKSILGFSNIHEENEVENKQRENLFHIYVKKLIQEYPSKGASALWNMVLEKHHREDDEIDPYCILIEVTPDEITWAAQGDTERTIKKGTFKNLVSDLKNK